MAWNSRHTKDRKLFKIRQVWYQQSRTRNTGPDFKLFKLKIEIQKCKIYQESLRMIENQVP